VALPLRPDNVASDNRRYAAADLPAVGIGLGGAGYHTPADTASRVNPVALSLAAKFITALGVSLARPR
jgi:aminopeptidase YwaD